MQFNPGLMPSLIQAIAATINANAEEVTNLDLAIGDGDHVTNLQRGIDALIAHSDEFSSLDWADAWQKAGMTLLSSVGGASGSLFGTLFIAMAKNARDQELDLHTFSEIFGKGVEAVKKRGKSDSGEKTMLDVLIPVSESLSQSALDSRPITETLENISDVAEKGMESTRDMLAIRGRASFLGERTIGHVDAGAKTTQLMTCAIAKVLLESIAKR